MTEHDDKSGAPVDASAEAALQDEIAGLHDMMVASKYPRERRHLWARMVDQSKRRRPRLRKKMGRLKGLDETGERHDD